MTQKRLPDLYKSKQGPTIGCADVTVVSVAAIASFAILILILSRADFSSVMENFGRSGAALVAPTAAVTTPNLSLIHI